MSFFGELYLRSTLPFLSAEVTRAELALLQQLFEEHPLPGPIADLGCGHGRHASGLTRRLKQRLLVGLELDLLSIQQRIRGFQLVRGDFFQLPFRDASLAGAYAWYSTLFTFEDERIRELMREIARAIKPDGVLVIQTCSWEWVERTGSGRQERMLPDGSLLTEQAQFNPVTGRDTVFRRLDLPDGRTLSADFFIRYHSLSQLDGLLESTGFTRVFTHGGADGSPLTPESVDLIIGAKRKHG